MSLAERCVSGDSDAQRELFRAHRRQVHGTLYRVLGSNRDMDDLVQEAFLEIFRSLGRFRGEAKLSTWIDRITARVAFNYLKRAKNRPVLLESVPDIESDDPSAERRAIARDAARNLYRLLDKLEPKYRIAFALHAIDGRPLREVARMTGSSLVATKSRAWRARKELEKRARQDPVLHAFLVGGKSARKDEEL
jgi:RNA polymerase sigma-70 factor (ECF subfamily)